MNAMAVIERLREQGIAVDRLCLDSRQVRLGDVFIALPGTHADGRRYIADATARGAAAILYEAGADEIANPGVPAIAVQDMAAMLGEIAHLVYGRPSEQLWVVGVTGTNGKTSVSQWIAQALNGLGRKCAVMGTIGNGFPGQLKESPNTTPDAIAVHSGLASFVAQKAAACAMEVSSIGLDQGRVNGVAFDTAVLTNLSRDHLDYHIGMEDYAAAKARLFEMSGLQSAVLNLDDPFGVQQARRLRGRVQTLGYTLADARGADEIVAAQGLRLSARGIRFSVDGQTIEAPVIGRFNVSNLLAVYGALKMAGTEAAQAAAALSRLVPPPGRLQIAGGAAGENSQPLVVVDYAHTPDALDKALDTLREVAKSRGGRLICVFGCGGDRDAGKRPMMGAVAERLADQVVITNDNPRSEDPQHIAAQIADGMRSKPLVELDRARAIEQTIASATVHDVVLIAGKGHEAYQEIAGVRQPFSDIAVAQEALERRA